MLQTGNGSTSMSLIFSITKTSADFIVNALPQSLNRVFKEMKLNQLTHLLRF
jgi:hypothetical protein